MQLSIVSYMSYVSLNCSRCESDNSSSCTEIACNTGESPTIRTYKKFFNSIKVLHDINIIYVGPGDAMVATGYTLLVAIYVFISSFAL